MKKNILVIMSRYPYPPIGGDRLKNYNLLKILSKHFNVHLVVITDEDVIGHHINMIGHFVHRQKVFKKKRWQTIVNAFKSIFTKNPIQVEYYYFKDVQKYIDKEIKNKEFAIATLIRTAKYLEKIKKTKYLDIVDSIGLNYQRSHRNVKSIFWRLLYKIETNLLLNCEQKYIEIFDNTFFVNKNEAKYWSKYGNTTWIPNGVQEMLFHYNKNNKTYKDHIAFFGNMEYQPNIDAVLWFVKNVFIHLDKKIKFIIVGQKPKKIIRDLASKYENIQVTGFAEDPYEYLNSTFAIIAPMQTGGGIQNKILECMALGKVNIISTLGATPIYGAKDKEHFLLADDIQTWINTIHDVFKHPDKYKQISRNSKEFIHKNYTWEHYEKKLMTMLSTNLNEV